MTTVIHTMVPGARTQIGDNTQLNALAIASFVLIGTIVVAGAVDIELEVAATAPAGVTPGASSLILYAKGSLDNVNFTSGPESGSTITDLSNLHRVGALALNTASVQQRDLFALAAAFGGILPPFIKIIAFNATGIALPTGGHSTFAASYTGASN
jgi:hypothetical protein